MQLEPDPLVAIVHTIPHAWQVRTPDFAQAYEPSGLTVEEFDGFGPPVRTLRGFIKSYHDLVRAIRDIVLPDL